MDDLHGKTIGSVGSLEPYSRDSSAREESPLSGKSCGVCLRYLLCVYTLAHICLGMYVYILRGCRVSGGTP